MDRIIHRTHTTMNMNVSVSRSMGSLSRCVASMLTRTPGMGMGMTNAMPMASPVPVRVLGTALRAYSSDFQGQSGAMSGGIQQVEWSSAKANSVSLIGRLGSEPEVKYLESGQTIANVSIAVYRGKEKNPHWFDLEMWNEVAQTAENYLHKGQLVQVTGRLNQSVWKDRMTGQSREKVRVNVDNLALVESSDNGFSPGNGQSSGNAWSQGDSAGGYRGGQTSVNNTKQKDVEATWAALFCSPNDFWDNRASKKNPKAPDFKHKETGEALWINSRSTPPWVESSLKELDTNKEVDMNTLFKDPRSNEEIPF